jgi:hypothetical protein
MPTTRSAFTAADGGKEARVVARCCRWCDLLERGEQRALHGEILEYGFDDEAASA